VTAFPGPITALTLFVDDLATSKAFYSEVFGLPAMYEDDASVVFNFGNTLINLLIATEADELITPAAVGGAGTPARAQLTITVDDVDATAALVVERGATLLNGPLDRPWGIRTAAFRDPAGHVWEIAS
jgi:catechol 2,3-dioxygenase-like lactoylglutathione lyase family enzyme